ncbi:hypothetical protein [Pseudomonas fluorescens]|uniref:hypothetical protein n=1 Tax=Pseudomonas fluorescens TaxID=294 RepID=UPI001786F23F|nr:hypothetical protein [Pseudomonas fluorescens]
MGRQLQDLTAVSVNRMLKKQNPEGWRLQGFYFRHHPLMSGEDDWQAIRAFNGKHQRLILPLFTGFSIGRPFLFRDIERVSKLLRRAQ